MTESDCASVADAMRRINRAWLDGRVDDLAPVLHPEIVMVMPGFSGQVQGRDALLAGFREFCEQARVHEFQEHEHHVSVAGDVGVSTFRYDMTFEREGRRTRSTGRDVWVFHRQGGTWVAVWRTMLDIEERAG